MTIQLKKPSIPYPRWTIEEDNQMKSFDPSLLSLHLEPEQKTGYISGNELRTRMKGTGLSASVLDYLIEHPELAPESWKEKTKEGNTQFIYFWGTIFRSSDGNLCVRSWYWYDGRWQTDYIWLDYDWGDDYPSAVLGKPSALAPESSLDTESLELRVQKLEHILAHYNLTEV